MFDILDLHLNLKHLQTSGPTLAAYFNNYPSIIFQLMYLQ